MINSDVYTYKFKCNCCAYMMEGYLDVFFNTATMCHQHYVMHKDDDVGRKKFIEKMTEEASKELVKVVPNQFFKAEDHFNLKGIRLAPND